MDVPETEEKMELQEAMVRPDVVELLVMLATTDVTDTQ